MSVAERQNQRDKKSLPWNECRLSREELAEVIAAQNDQPLLVQHFGERFFTAAGCPASLDDEASRRGKRRLNGHGRDTLSRRNRTAAAA